MEQVVVETTGWIRTGVDAETVEVELRYDPADPCAVRVAVSNPQHDHRWVLARELLANGLRSTLPLGEGVVRVHATSVLAEIEVVRPGQPPMVLRLPWWNTREFLRMTQAVVPIGTEEYDVDQWLVGLIKSRDV